MTINNLFCFPSSHIPNHGEGEHSAEVALSGFTSEEKETIFSLLQRVRKNIEEISQITYPFMTLIIHNVIIH
jgi:hypothetical protein